MKMEIENVLPTEIEKRSFEIITEELQKEGIVLPEKEAPIIKRCIHTSADFDYARNLIFSEDVTEQALEAIRNGASIVTDTQMGRSGINKKELGRYGGKVYCFMSDDDVAERAKQNVTYDNFRVGNVINDCLKKTHVPGGIVLVDRQFSIKSR